MPGPEASNEHVHTNEIRLFDNETQVMHVHLL